MSIIGQNSKLVHLTYAFHELLIFFWLALVDIFKFDFSLSQRKQSPRRAIEAVDQTCSVKKVFLEILQDSQENSLRPATLLK